MSQDRIAYEIIEEFAHDNFTEWAVGNNDEELEERFTTVVLNEVGYTFAMEDHPHILSSSLAILWALFEDLAEEGVPA